MNYAKTLGVTASATALPFTGLAVGWWMAAAVTALFTGIALRQLWRRPSSVRP